MKNKFIILLSVAVVGLTPITASADDVARSVTDVADMQTGYVTADIGLNVREEPNTDCEIVDALPYAEEVRYVPINDEWGQTEDGDYICITYVDDEEPEPLKVGTNSESGTQGAYIGKFKITHYCACSKCCGKSNGITATGTHATAGRTIAADPSVLPYGSKVMINGHIYTVEDCGGGVGGSHIDIFCSSHSEALQKGTYYTDVYWAE